MAASEHPARPKPAFVYMVRCTGGQLYTGWTNAPAARLQAHKSGMEGIRFCHASRFLITADTKETAVAACRFALKASGRPVHEA